MLFFTKSTLAHAKIKRTAGFALQKKANKELKKNRLTLTNKSAYFILILY